MDDFQRAFAEAKKEDHARELAEKLLEALVVAAESNSIIRLVTPTERRQVAKLMAAVLGHSADVV